MSNYSKNILTQLLYLDVNGLLNMRNTLLKSSHNDADLLVHVINKLLSRSTYGKGNNPSTIKSGRNNNEDDDNNGKKYNKLKENREDEPYNPYNMKPKHLRRYTAIYMNENDHELVTQIVRIYNQLSSRNLQDMKPRQARDLLKRMTAIATILQSRGIFSRGDIVWSRLVRKRQDQVMLHVINSDGF